MPKNELFNGSLNLILGPMYSSKTSTLITRYTRHTIAGRNCLMIKYKQDTRYDKSMIVTHNGVKVEAIPCEFLYEADKIVKDYDVICIDEVQFYKDAYIFCDKWANEGRIIEACGLNGTFQRKPFYVISRLIARADNITYLTSICRETGKDAHYSKRNTNDMGEVVIGGSDIYSAADRKTFFKNRELEWHQENLLEFVEVYVQDQELVSNITKKINQLTLKDFEKLDYKSFVESNKTNN